MNSHQDLGLFQYHFIDNSAASTLVLLHGTGGDEQDLLPLVDGLEDRFNILGLRGNVDENGMARFFARQALGVFDQKSIMSEVKKLAHFLDAWCEERATTPQELNYVGYSNGANMVLALAFEQPRLVWKAALLHPMLPFEPREVDLAQRAFLVTYGERDPLISAEGSREVGKILEQLAATVRLVSHPGGHEIQINEVTALQEFLKQSEL